MRIIIGQFTTVITINWFGGRSVIRLSPDRKCLSHVRFILLVLQLRLLSSCCACAFLVYSANLQQGKRNHFDREICYMSWSSISHTAIQPSIQPSIQPAIKSSIESVNQPVSHARPIQSYQLWQIFAHACLWLCRWLSIRLWKKKRQSFVVSPNLFICTLPHPLLGSFLVPMIFHIFPQLVSSAALPYLLWTLYDVYYLHLSVPIYVIYL